jgi:hypothetical protein
MLITLLHLVKLFNECKLRILSTLRLCVSALKKNESRGEKTHDNIAA